MRVFVFVIILCLLPLATMAGKVAILPVEYTSAQTGEALPDAASKVEGKVVEGAREAGFEVVRGDAVEEVLAQAAEGDGRCATKACLEKVRAALNVDEAIFVSVKDDNQSDYTIRVQAALHEGFEDERTAGLFVILEWIRGQVALLLQKPVETESVQDAKVETPVNDAHTAADNTENAKEEKPEEVQSKHKKLSPFPFYITAAATAGLAIGWGITDIVVHSKYNDLKKVDEYDEQAEWNKQKEKALNLQVVDRVLLGCTIAGIVATGALAIFTDFKEKKESAGISAVAPYASAEGAGLAMRGSF